jgi:hypothetical protein
MKTLLQKLYHAFEVESYRELAKRLKVAEMALYKWRERENAQPPVELPPNVKGMLTIILNQQLKIIELEKRLCQKENSNNIESQP